MWVYRGRKSVPQRLVIGKVSACFGVKGWVKIVSFTRPPELIFDYKKYRLNNGDEQQEVCLAEYSSKGHRLLARFERWENRDQAKQISGSEITIDASQLPVLNEGEYYWKDLIDLQVFDTQGHYFGCIEKLLETGANDVLVIRSPDSNQEQLIPYAPEIIVNVDLSAGRMIVEWEIE